MTHLCPERPQSPHPFNLPDHDEWRLMPDGTRTCSYCGSLHEDDFIDIVSKYLEGVDDYHFDTTTKNYKWYARRPGVENASQGGIKFYTWHVDRTDPERLNKNAEIVGKASRKHAEWMKERFGS